MLRVIEGDLADQRVIDLLRIHLTTARAETAPGSAHALDLTGLKSPDVSFWTIWEEQTTNVNCRLPQALLLHLHLILLVISDS